MPTPNDEDFEVNRRRPGALETEMFRAVQRVGNDLAEIKAEIRLLKSVQDHSTSQLQKLDAQQTEMNKTIVSLNYKTGIWGAITAAVIGAGMLIWYLLSKQGG